MYPRPSEVLVYSRQLLLRLLLAAAFFLPALALAAADPLPSWNDGAPKRNIVEFVGRVTSQGDLEFVDPAKRIAVFDNDGTLWPEQPMYFQLVFAIDTIKALAPQHPEWHRQQPFKAVLDGDMKALESLDQHALMELITVSHAGMTTDEFSGSVRLWLRHARHPRYKVRYSRLAYQPMIELLDYLRTNQFKTFIVSGGGVDFMRVFAQEVYGIPPEQVIGSSGVTRFQMDAKGQPVLIKEAKIEFVDDGPGKPSGIHRFIGRRPIFAFGNSDGDRQMLEWTAGGGGLKFIGLVHHTDVEREFAYDRDSRIGKLDKALDEANARKWNVVDMKRDWRAVFSQP